MQSDASLPWLALALTPGLASRLSARVLRRFDSPHGVFSSAPHFPISSPAISRLKSPKPS